MSSKWIYGWGGHARVIDRHWKADFIVDDDPLKGAVNRRGGSWVPSIPNTFRYGLIAIGDNKTRKMIRDRIEKDEPMYGMLILWDDAQPYCGIGTVVLDGAVVQPGCHIGEHVIINTNASVDHDCRIGDFAHIAPGAVLCGGVEIGEGTLVGANATILPGVKVPPWKVVRAGSIVTVDGWGRLDD